MHGSNTISIIADDAIPFLKGVTDDVANIRYVKGSAITRSMLEGVDALIIRTRTKCNKALLEGTGVSFIGTATIGFDHIDTEFCSANGITWANAPGCNSSSVMQYMVAALLQICIRYNLEPREITLGVVGAGNVGSKVAEAGAILGMRVLINDPPREAREGKGMFTSITEIVREADIITLHVPLTLEGPYPTFHLAGREFIDAMKRGSFLVNTSRGGVTDEEEVKRALWSGQLKGYIADVWHCEPAVDAELVEMTEISTPHTAGYSADGKMNGTRIIVQALSSHFNIPVILPAEDILPPPLSNIIDLSRFAGTDLDILNGIVTSTIDIAAESRQFKVDLSRFEAIRNNYPARREFKAYHISGDGPVSEIAIRLGFRRKV